MIAYPLGDLRDLQILIHQLPGAGDALFNDVTDQGGPGDIFEQLADVRYAVIVFFCNVLQESFSDRFCST